MDVFHCVALLAFCIGGAAFFGWVFENEFLKRIHPSLVTMKANTAVCLMLVGISILLIPDSFGLEQLLKMCGANITTATNGADALRIAADNEFDVILSDISMPEMDGFEFLQRLRQIKGQEHVPVVAITGFGRSDDIQRARGAGFYSHLTKPLNIQALAEVLDQLSLHQRRRGANGTDHNPDTDFDATAGPVC